MNIINVIIVFLMFCFWVAVILGASWLKMYGPDMFIANEKGVNGTLLLLVPVLFLGSLIVTYMLVPIQDLNKEPKE